MEKKNLGLVDSECIEIEEGDILASLAEESFLVATVDAVSDIGDGSGWRVVGAIQQGESLSDALDRIKKEVEN